MLEMDAPEPKPKATLVDVEALPAHVTGELVEGTLLVSPRPRFLHSVVESELPDLLRDGLGDARTRWRFVVEPELRLGPGPDVLVPDVAAWPSPGPSPASDGYVHVPPPWLCEVLSPSTARADWTVKRAAYERHGVQHLWLLDLAGRALHVLGAGAEGATYDGPITPPLAPFGVPVELARLWRLLPT